MKRPSDHYAMHPLNWPMVAGYLAMKFRGWAKANAANPYPFDSWPYRQFMLGCSYYD